MMALILSLFSNPTVLAIGGGIVAVLAAFMKGRTSGAARERQKQASERLRARKAADEIDDAIAGRSADENRKRLREWGK